MKNKKFHESMPETVEAICFFFFFRGVEIAVKREEGRGVYLTYLGFEALLMIDRGILTSPL